MTFESICYILMIFEDNLKWRIRMACHLFLYQIDIPFEESALDILYYNTEYRHFIKVVCFISLFEQSRNDEY